MQRGVRAWWLLIPLAVTCWAFVHEARVHATVAGAALGFVVPVAVLCGSLLAAICGGAILARRSQAYRRRATAQASVGNVAGARAQSRST